MKQHQLALRVYLEDVDQYGIVYHPKYLHYFERARIEFLREHGCELPALSELGYSLVIQKAELRYLKPAYYDNELLIRSHIVRFGHASLLYSQQIVLQHDFDYEICQAKIKIACVDKAFIPCPLPDLLKEIA